MDNQTPAGKMATVMKELDQVADAMRGKNEAAAACVGQRAVEKTQKPGIQDERMMRHEKDAEQRWREAAEKAADAENKAKYDRAASDPFQIVNTGDRYGRLGQWRNVNYG